MADGDAVSNQGDVQHVTAIPRRYVLVILSLFALFICSVHRVNLSIAIVAMTTNHSAPTNGTKIYHPDIDWGSEEQGVALASFFYGACMTQMLGGILAPIIGGGRLVGTAIFIGSVLNIMMPYFAKMGFVPFIVVRILSGISQGVVFPAIHELWSHWAPPLENTKMLSITYSGSYLGTVGSMGLCGIIATHLGWSWIFYISGFLGLLWCVFWFLIVREDPSLDRFISQQELKYLTSNIQKCHKTKFSDAPWGSIFTSGPVWASIVSCLTESYTYYLLMTQLPIYLHDVTDFNLEDVGFLAAMPYLAMTITAQFSSVVVDYLRSKYHVTTTKVRKITTCGAYLTQAIVLVLIGYIDSLVASLTCIVITLAVSGCSCFTINFFDLAPQYASLIIGVSTTLNHIAGLIGPTVTGFIVHEGTAAEWHIVFYIAAGLASFGCIFYAIFGSGEIQPWAIQNTGSTVKVENTIAEDPALYTINEAYEVEVESREYIGTGTHKD